MMARGERSVILAMLFLFVLGSGDASAGTWYRGDLHAHSLYSDGDSSVADMIAQAEKLGLDFFVLTDHDTSLNGDPRHWYNTGYTSAKMVLLYGMEWTTAYGHANVWAARPFSYRSLWQANRDHDPEAALAAAHAEGALFSINHPASAIFSLSWEYPVPEGVDAIEVWNSLYRLPSLNRWAGHRFWDDLLKQGRRIPGTGGSDAHMLQGWMSRFWGPGNPTTWVYAEARTAEDILAGIAAGHVSISYSPDALRAVLSADADNDGEYETLCGDTMAGNGQVVTFKVSLEPPQDDDVAEKAQVVELDGDVVARLSAGPLQTTDLSAAAGAENMPVFLVGILKNGRLFKAFVVMGATGSCLFKEKAVGPAYYRAEVMGTPSVEPLHHLLYGRVIALTNPVYVDGR